MNIQTLRERRARTIAQMRALTDAASKADRDLSEEEVRSFDGFKAELTRLDGELERATFLADAERSMATDPRSPRRGNDGSFDDACRQFSLSRALAHMIAPGEVDAGREIEISRELATRSGRKPQGLWVPHSIFQEQRAVTAGGSGGNLVPRTLRDDLFIDRLRANLVVERAGATILNDLAGSPIDIPRLTTSASTYWVAEHAAVTGSDHVFDKVTLQPKTVGALVEYSRRMLINATASVEALIRSDLAKKVAEEIDAKALAGDGTSNTPTGVLNVSGTTAVDHGGSGGPPTWAKVLEFVRAVELANAAGGNLSFITNPKVVQKMRSTVRVATTDSRMIQEEPNALAGYPLFSTNSVPSNYTETTANLSGMVFGNWADLLIGYWSALDVVVNPYSDTVYAKGGVLVIALQDVDVQTRHPESFAVAKDINTA